MPISLLSSEEDARSDEGSGGSDDNKEVSMDNPLSRPQARFPRLHFDPSHTYRIDEELARGDLLTLVIDIVAHQGCNTAEDRASSRRAIRQPVFHVEAAMQRFQLDASSALHLMRAHGSEDDPQLKAASMHHMKCLAALDKACSLEAGPAKVVLGAVHWDLYQAISRTKTMRRRVGDIFPAVNGRTLDVLLGKHGFDCERVVDFVTTATEAFLQGQEFVTEALEATQFLIDSDFDVEAAVNRARNMARNMRIMAGLASDDADESKAGDNTGNHERDDECELCGAVMWTRGEELPTPRELRVILDQGKCPGVRGRFECANDGCSESHDVCERCVRRWHRAPLHLGHAKCPWCRGRLMASRRGY